MGISDDLAERIRGLVGLDPRVTEKRMFGGLTFLLNGKIMVAARRTGTLLVQCGAANAAEVTTEPGVTQMIMRGKPTPNFVDVDYDRLETDDDLGRWIALAERYLSSLASA